MRVLGLLLATMAAVAIAAVPAELPDADIAEEFIPDVSCLRALKPVA